MTNVNSHPDVSVIIVNYNTKLLLRNCLCSLPDASRGLRLEVIVVDNASTDGSVEMCREQFPHVAVIQNHDNKGFGTANNQGIRSSKAASVLLLNSDTVVCSGTITCLLQQFRERPELGVLGCRIIGADGQPQCAAYRFPTVTTVLIERLLLYKIVSSARRTEMRSTELGDGGECEWISGACMMIRRAALEAVGGFDEQIWMYGEELELCYRISGAGWKIACDLEATIVHLGGASWADAKCSNTKLKIEGLLLFFRRYRTRPCYVLALLLAALGAIVRIALWAGLSALRPTFRGEALAEVRANIAVLQAVRRGSPASTSLDRLYIS